MFGRRPDGRAVKAGVDPITRFTPYIMVERADSQCYCTQYADADIIKAYLRKKRGEGIKIGKMELIIAAYVRMLAHMPHLNRFVVGKKLYARNELCVSFAMLKSRSKDEFLETTVKVYFDPANDTVFDVSRKVQQTIEQNRELSNSNATDKVANAILAMPFLASAGVGFLKLLDYFGLLPRAIIDASPFHTSMFITNMGSIGLGALHHHIYNFGTTTVFLGLGKLQNKLVMAGDGSIKKKAQYPIAVTIDERVCPGALYAAAFKYLDRYLRHPELLESPPDASEVRYDVGCEYVYRERSH
ncbi:MAG: 2-oxo acid dehydrogenase subunit E2 [Oscillospiraceae bacterium]|nr:2-oxo acid dehydrogenase subunit E2 [Oscillospiraceae bacterium]